VGHSSRPSTSSSSSMSLISSKKSHSRTPSENSGRPPPWSPFDDINRVGFGFDSDSSRSGQSSLTSPPRALSSAGHTPTSSLRTPYEKFEPKVDRPRLLDQKIISAPILSGPKPLVTLASLASKNPAAPTATGSEPQVGSTAPLAISKKPSISKTILKPGEPATSRRSQAGVNANPRYSHASTLSTRSKAQQTPPVSTMPNPRRWSRLLGIHDSGSMSSIPSLSAFDPTITNADVPTTTTAPSPRIGFHSRSKVQPRFDIVTPGNRASFVTATTTPSVYSDHGPEPVGIAYGGEDYEAEETIEEEGDGDAVRGYMKYAEGEEAVEY